MNAIVDKKFIYTNLLVGNDKIILKGDIKDFPWNVDIKRDSMVQAFMKLPQKDKQEIGETIWVKIRKMTALQKIYALNI